MTAKERILLQLVVALTRVAEWHFHEKPEGLWVERGKPKPGDLVAAMSSGGFGRCAPHPYLVGFYVKDLHTSMDGGTVRELGSDRLCDIHNEYFTIIHGVRPEILYSDREFTFYNKVLKAFKRGDELVYRFGGLVFHSDTEVTISIRAWFGRGKPFPCRMRYNARTTIKSILAAMVEAGYGTRPFEPIEESVVEGHDYEVDSIPY